MSSKVTYGALAVLAILCAYLGFEKSRLTVELQQAQGMLHGAEAKLQEAEETAAGHESDAAVRKRMDCELAAGVVVRTYAQPSDDAVIASFIRLNGLEYAKRCVQ